MVEAIQQAAIRKSLAVPLWRVEKNSETITYSLTRGKTNSQEYYEDAAQLTDVVLKEAEQCLFSIIREFEASIQQNDLESLRSSKEYLLEALTLGVLWMVYAPHAVTFSPAASGLFHTLIALRRRYRWLKPGIDTVRGILATLLLMPKHTSSQTRVPQTKENLARLLNWLSVTGEFKEEIKRLQYWQAFLANLPAQKVAEYLKAISAFARWFKFQSKASLGKYTTHVEDFLQKSYPQTYRWREDMIFCGRQEVEYHLIMVGAEILNRVFRADFLQTPRKAVLLPACMRARPAAECRARKDGLDITCTGCTPGCRVRHFNQLGKEQGFDVYVIHHSSDFTKWLERWQDTREVGVVGVACILNLFTGGYEMKDLNIPSQCMLLDYCGCQNHWHPEGIPTDIDQKQLLHTLSCCSSARANRN